MVQFPELQNSKTQNRTIYIYIWFWNIYKLVVSKEGCERRGTCFILNTPVLFEFVKIYAVVTYVMKGNYIKIKETLQNHPRIHSLGTVVATTPHLNNWPVSIQISHQYFSLPSESTDFIMHRTHFDSFSSLRTAHLCSPVKPVSTWRQEYCLIDILFPAFLPSSSLFST